jgi:uncharacterized protein YhbP (UPF0306 family)
MRRIVPWIHRSEIRQWCEINFYSFICKEVELQGKTERDTRDFVFYSERSSDQYEIFLVKFPKELLHWIDRLQEAPELQ